MGRATKVGQELASGTLEYPGEDEYNEPPDHFDAYMRCFYGQKGIGKTTAASTFPNSLTLMLEPKRRGLRIRQLALQKHTAEQIMEGAPDTYQLVANTTQKWIDDESIKHLNYDSIDIFYEACTHSVCARNNITKPSEAGRSSSEIWNEIRDEFSGYFDTLRDTDMGINLLSHNKARDVETLEGGKMGFVAPSCSPACLKYIQQAVDIVLYFGWYNGERSCMVRDETNSAFVANGVADKFLQPDGKPISIFAIPDIEKKPTYEVLVDAFDNKLWDVDTPEDEREVKKKGPPKKAPPRK